MNPRKNQATLNHFSRAGFRLKQSQYCPEEESDLFLFEHRKTGARLFYMKNDDTNRTFAIGFRTPPLGSIGNCHILEHCVLNGSRKYRTKEPFMDLLKSSLQTFMNALTYPDKTVFPIASRNERDFQNLMDLYLDAVFFPLAVEDPAIFRQEGWRYSLLDADDPIRYEGVVYNEMKGAMSTPEAQVDDQLSRELFSGSIYAENSGGDPSSIPSLSYEDFRQYHKKYYHPSNSYTFLYGAIEEEKTAARLASYFDLFEREEADSLPGLAAPWSVPREGEAYYSVASSAKEADPYLSCSWILDEARTDGAAYYYQLLPQLLIAADSSPLRSALIDELGAKDVNYSLNDLRQISFSITAKGVEAGRKDEFLAIIRREVGKMVKEGVDPRLIEGHLHALEFDRREKGGMPTKGVALMDAAMTEWLYGLNPLEKFQLDKNLADFKQELAQGGLENYLQSRLLDNPHRLLMAHLPQPGKNAEREKELSRQLAAYKSKLSKQEIQQLVEENQALLKKQTEADSEEALATIPRLTKEDLPETFMKVPRQLRVDRAAPSAYPDTYLLHPLPTAGIHYISLVFDASSVPAEEAPYLMLVCALLGKMDTKNYHYQDYSDEERYYTGGITADPSVVQKWGTKDDFQPYLILSTKVLGDDYLDKAMELMEEQALRTDLSDGKRRQEVLNELLSMTQAGLVPSGHHYARLQAAAQLSPASSYSNQLRGIPFLKRLEGWTRHFSENDQAILLSTYQRVFHSPCRTISITTEADRMETVYQAVQRMVRRFPREAAVPAPSRFQPRKRKEGWYTNTDVQFCSIAAPFPTDGFHGSSLVLSNILSLDYLYKEVRAKAGAYGVGMTVSLSNHFSTYSYRDPNLEKTLAVYQGLGRAAASLSLDEEGLTPYIIGAMGSFDQPMTEVMKGNFDLYNYLAGRQPEFYDQIMQEIRDCRPENIQALLAPLEEAVQSAATVVIGSEEKMREAEGLFDQLEEI